jgi:ABC-2 type transport system ATP-binding protein
MKHAIELHQVSRSFGDVNAITDVDLAVPSGTVAVLLGPNGAGKTTSVRIMTGALRPDFGFVRVNGLDPAVDGQQVRMTCGVVPPKPALYDRLSGWDNLRFAADLYGAPHSRIPEAAARFGIDHALGQEAGGYSTGMRTRLALARAVLHDPEILLLDEPTAGLDPESARAVLGLIREIAGRGNTIVMCTHLLHEAEGIADQVVLMDEGTVRAAGKPRDLAGRYIPQPIVLLDAEERSLLEPATHLDGVIRSEWNGGLRITVDALDRLPDIVNKLVANGARLTRVEPQVPTLEQLYFEMQRAHREEAP